MKFRDELNLHHWGDVAEITTTSPADSIEAGDNELHALRRSAISRVA